MTASGLRMQGRTFIRKVMGRRSVMQHGILFIQNWCQGCGRRNTHFRLRDGRRGSQWEMSFWLHGLFHLRCLLFSFGGFRCGLYQIKQSLISGGEGCCWKILVSSFSFCLFELFIGHMWNIYGVWKGSKSQRRPRDLASPPVLSQDSLRSKYHIDLRRFPFLEGKRSAG